MPSRQKPRSGSKRPFSPRALRYLKTRAAWLIDAVTPRGKRSAERDLRDGLKLARRFYSGLGADQGFDARRVRYWPADRVEAVRRLIASARRLTSGEGHELYRLVRPRTTGQAAALRLHTSQESPDPKHPQRVWAVYANVSRVRVRYIKESVPIGAAMGRPIYEERLRVEVLRGVKGGVLVHRDYLFREVLGFQPGVDSTSIEGLRVGRLLGTYDPWEQMVRAMGVLVRRLPARTTGGGEAYYRLLSDRGPVGSSVPRHMLVSRMQRWGDKYDETFVEMLIGARFQGDEFRARKLGVEADERRARYRRLANERRLARARVTWTGELQSIPTTAKDSKKKKKKKSKKRSDKKLHKKLQKQAARLRAPKRYK